MVANQKAPVNDFVENSKTLTGGKVLLSSWVKFKGFCAKIEMYGKS
jgi:hypothetical protein